jgi:flagellar biosynthetic protein FliR
VIESYPPELVAISLAFFRIGGMMLVAPVFSSRTVPRMVRAGFAVLLTILVYPAVGETSASVVVGPGTLVAEMIVGLGIGLGAATLLAGAELAGEVLAVQTGLSGATALDPLSGQGTPVLGNLLQFVALVLLLVTGGHLFMIEVLATSYEVVPVGAGFDLTAGALELFLTAGLLFTQGLQLAAPIIAAVSVGYVALGVLARASPQLNMLAVAFPLQIGLGLVVLAAVLPMATTTYAEWPRHIAVMAERFLGALRAN